jgi:hypothetical protein
VTSPIVRTAPRVAPRRVKRLEILRDEQIGQPALVALWCEVAVIDEVDAQLWDGEGR